MNTPAQRFHVGSFGRSGTVWLSKLLNAHPEVLCFHEGAIMHHHPSPWLEAGAVETLRWVSSMNDLAQWNVGFTCYRSLGDVNSIGGFHRTTPFTNEFFRAMTHARLAEALGGLPLFLLMREPIASIESKLRMLELHRGVYLSYAREYLSVVVEGSGIENTDWWAAILASDDASLRVMLMLHWRFVAQLRALKIFRLEEIGQNPQAAAAAAAEISGISIGWDVVAAGARQRENVGAGSGESAAAILTRWSEAERHAFRELCASEAQRMGYPQEGTLLPPRYLPRLDRPGALDVDRRWQVVPASPARGRWRVGVWGTGEGGLKVLEALAGFDGIGPIWSVDNDPTKQGKRWMGLEVKAPAALAKRPVDLLIVASLHRDDIRAQLESLGRCAARVLFPDVSVSVADLRRQFGDDFAPSSFLEGTDGT